VTALIVLVPIHAAALAMLMIVVCHFERTPFLTRGGGDSQAALPSHSMAQGLQGVCHGNAPPRVSRRPGEALGNDAVVGARSRVVCARHQRAHCAIVVRLPRYGLPWVASESSSRVRFARQ
jgi:hypothetical protein